MTCWLRYSHRGDMGFGTLDGTLADGIIHVHRGNLFDAPTATGATLSAAEVALLAPCVPSKMPALWNNFHARAAKEGLPLPADPLYFLKGNNSFCAHGTVIRKPAHFDGKVVFEGELGIVIGRRMTNVAEADAPAHIFGYTCVNDVTAADILRMDKTFEQWVRSKSFDTFCPIGPGIVTGIDPAGLVVKSVLVQPDGQVQERQNYPVSDMIFSPAQLASLISRDMTLEPGDIIACGTSVGAGAMKPGSTIRIEIPGVGVLENRYEA
ncbi:MAG: fumarylacetoacetate hydrolase family protein [Burkholderiales bacterium]|nr:fumarylacetoacetate hydrolase family protein [Burkholderiales bacterium]